jgi:transcription elongation factor GreA
MAGRDRVGHGVSMTPSTMTPADFDQLVQELDSLRAAHRDALARQLRDARSFGSPGDDDDWLTVMEDTAVDRGRIARLERLVAAATVVDAPASSGRGAGLGMSVRVRDEAGRTLDYELAGRRRSHDPPALVSVGSPIGRALTGSQPGDVVQVELPSGRRRSLSVIDVRVARDGHDATD